MSLGRVLVVDDEKNIALVLEAMLEKEGFEVLAFQDPGRALEAIADEEFDAVITDLRMPGTDGMEVLRHAQKEQPRLPVIIVTAFGTVEAAVSALKQGAYDFVTKPFDRTELIQTVQKAVATSRQRAKEPGGDAGFSLIGSGPAMEEVFRVISRIAPSSSTVLIWGESGTGKELVAYEIHRHSPRARKPFVKINCAAIPANLIESELFGHERGAFTGAVASKPGRFELAHEGTLFLDEVAEMPPEMQVKLLRVLQEQEFERVGGVSTIRVDVRIVTASNKDLEAEVRAGRFREDLFYRLNVVPIRLPALRDRVEDIEPLVRFFLGQFGERLKKRIDGIEPACLEAFRAYSWPGNIRQLENVLERMVLLSDTSRLRVEDLPEELAGAARPLPGDAEGETASAGSRAETGFKDIVRRRTQLLERELIEKALEETGGNVTRTADRLGLSRKGLQLKMKELGIRR
jgi:nitrogen regulation protein NR(I)